jgi:hypothetical protein
MAEYNSTISQVGGLLPSGNMIPSFSTEIVLPAILSFVACNAYLAVNHLRRVQTIAALTLESSAIQAEVSAVLKDITIWRQLSADSC